MEQENNQQPQTNDRIALIERYLLDPEKTILEMLNDFGGSIEEIKRALADVDLATLETLRGEDGITPVRGIDYMTDEDIDAFEAFILDRMPVLGEDVPDVEQVNTYIDEKVAKIPRIKGDKGEKGTAGTNGKNGSPDSPKDILEKLRSLPKNQGLQIKDVRGLSSKITQLDETTDDLELLRQELSQVRISIPTNNGSSATGTVTQIDTGTGLEGGPITNTGTIQLNAASIASLAKADSALQNITGLIVQGTNVTITGSGTSVSPYVINASGGGSTPTLQQVLDTGNDANNQSISLLDTVTSDLAEMNTFGFSVNSIGGFQSFLSSTGLSIRQSLNDNNVVSATMTADRTQTLQDRSGTLAHLDQISLSTLGITATATELNYSSGVTSSIQSQINGKQAALSGTGFVKISGTTISYDNSTYLTTTAAAAAYQPLDSDLTSWAGVTRASGFDTFVVTPSSANLAALVTDETGSGALVFGTAPSISGATITTSTVNGVTLTTGGGTTNFLRADGTYAAPSGGGITWTEVTGTTQAAAVNSGYITNNAGLVTVTLPSTAAVGSIVRITGKGAGGWRLAQNASQQVIWMEGGVDGTNETTVGTGGRIDSTDDYDSVELICITANNIWGVLSSKGNPSLT